MAPRIDLKHIRQNSDFETVLAHYNIKLIGSGVQRQILCPFHDDHNPSCGVNLKKRLFNCLACGAGGNILEFVMYIDDLKLRPAGMKLAEICGIETAPTNGKVRPTRFQRTEKKDEPEPEPEAEEASAPEEEGEGERPRFNKWFDQELKGLDPTHPYLAERGISEAMIEEFGIGYCNRGMMKERIAIPIHDPSGEHISAYAGEWAGRPVPKDKPKYLLPKDWFKQLELFNIHRLLTDAKSVVIVESYWSVFRLHEMNVPVVSPMGRSISTEQIDLLRMHGIDHVLLLFDGDDAGRSGTEAALPSLAQHFYVRAPEVPDRFKPHKASEEELIELLDTSL